MWFELTGFDCDWLATHSWSSYYCNHTKYNYSISAHSYHFGHLHLQFDSTAVSHGNWNACGELGLIAEPFLRLPSLKTCRFWFRVVEVWVWAATQTLTSTATSCSLWRKDTRLWMERFVLFYISLSNLMPAASGKTRILPLDLKILQNLKSQDFFYFSFMSVLVISIWNLLFLTLVKTKSLVYKIQVFYRGFK